MNDIATYSTLNLIFGEDPYWIFDKDTWKTSDNETFNFFQSAESKEITDSLFWKNVASRIYQYDNMQYNSIASIQFEQKLFKYKINFNPIKCYDFAMYCYAVSKSLIPHPGEEWTDEFDLLPYINKLNDSEDMKNIGWKESFYHILHVEKWTEDNWKVWNDLIYRTQYLYDTVLYVFVHEMIHFLWNHVNRMVESKDFQNFNIAADFAINQNLLFPKEIKKFLITQFNDNFMPNASYCFLRYLHKTDKLSLSNKMRELIKSREDFLKFCEKDMKSINDTLNFNSNNLINNKNADFYYYVFKNHMNLPNAPWIKIFDHNNKGEDQKQDDAEGRDSDDEYDMITGDMLGDSLDGKSRGSDEEDANKGSVEKIEADKILRESLENSELNSRGRTEIPLSFPFKHKINEIIKQRKDNIWKKKLNKFIYSYMNEKEKDITMTRANRKRPDIFPGLKREVGLDIIFVIDTSGSIGPDDFKLFISEIKNVNKVCDLDKCRIMQCHTTVSQDDRKFSLRKINSITFAETGGTRMRSALDILVAENNRKPVIIFTDGDIDYFTQEEFKFKVLLFITEKENVSKIEKRGFSVICPK